MTAKGGKAAEPYRLPAAFERAVVVTACTRPRFMAKVGSSVDADLLAEEPARQAMHAAQLIWKETGRGPSAMSVVLQRLQRQSDEGKITSAQIRAVLDLFDSALMDGLPTEGDVEGQLVPVLQGRIAHEVAKAGLDAYGKGNGFKEVETLISKAKALGVNDQGTGTTLRGAAAEIATLKGMERLPTGIGEVDTSLDGGLPIGTVGLIIAGPGGAKSMGLTHFSGNALLLGQNVAYATLELSRAEVLSRVGAFLTGIPTKQIRSGGMDRAAYIMGEMPLGNFHVMDFTAKGTTVGDLVAWVERCEEEDGRPIDFVALDYIDLCTKSKDSKGSSYTEQGDSMWEFHTFIKERKKRGWTGSQSKGREERKGKKVDMEHTADSMHKPRVADVVLTFNYNDETNEMGIFNAKHRFGDSRKMIGPLPAYFATGQIAPIERDPRHAEWVQRGTLAWQAAMALALPEPGSDG